MWPILLDMTKEESMQHLRCLEIDAFSGLVNALRAQGNLSNEKLKLLKETGTMLHISQDRHKAEIRRVVNDERLNTIAYYVNGERHSVDEWADEGQRLIPLIQRVAPQTAYSAIADEVADSASKLNKQLPLPASTERKRPLPVSPTHSNVNSHPSTSSSEASNKQFRSETENKKRKLSVNLENCALAQHLMAPPKISKIQQIYRQKSKAKLKEDLLRLKPPDTEKEYILQQIGTPKTSSAPLQQLVTKTQPSKVMTNPASLTTTTPPPSNPKLNIVQNISTSSPALDGESSTSSLISEDSPAPQKPVAPAECKPTKPTALQPTRRALPSKTITTTDGQKLIVVSSMPHTRPNSTITPTTTSILQRTLTTIPFKNISMKSLDKFKIVSAAGGSTKQKIVTVRNPPTKKIIPLSQVQVVNTKGGLKVVPLTNKILTKTSAISSNSHPTSSTQPRIADETTKSTTSTSVTMCTTLQEAVEDVVQTPEAPPAATNSIEEPPPETDPIKEPPEEMNAIKEEPLTTTAIEEPPAPVEAPEVTSTPTEKEAEKPVGEEEAGEIVDEDKTCYNNGVNDVVNEVDVKEHALEFTNFSEEVAGGDMLEPMMVAHEEVHEISNNGIDFDMIREQDMSESQVSLPITNNIGAFAKIPLANQLNCAYPSKDATSFDLQNAGVYTETELLKSKVVIGEVNAAAPHLPVFNEKVELDSSLFVYDNEHSEEVIIDGIEEQSIDMLNVVPTLDEAASYTNGKNVRS